MVFNHAAFLVGVVAAIAALVVDKEAAAADHVVLVVMFATGGVVAGAMELFLRGAWRPRVFWVVPVWTVGVSGVGAGLLSGGYPIPGAALIAAGAIAFAVHIALESRKPGGRWVGVAVAAIVGILAETLAEQAVTSAKPWWGFAVRGALIVVAGYALVRLWLERRRVTAE